MGYSDHRDTVHDGRAVGGSGVEAEIKEVACGMYLNQTFQRTHARGAMPQRSEAARINRGTTSYLNEPAVTGGNPVLADGKVMFNDMLGSTLGTLDKGVYSPVSMTAFGETDDASAFFTGKPMIGELGYAFLMRNYRPDLGKWQTADPLGYPDGWNNFAYCNNDAVNAIDFGGSCEIDVSSSNVTVNATDGTVDNGYTASVSALLSGQSYTITPTPAEHYLYELTFHVDITISVNGNVIDTSSYYYTTTRKPDSESGAMVFNEFKSSGSNTSASRSAGFNETVEITISGALTLVVRTDNNLYECGVYNYSDSAIAIGPTE